MQYKIGAMILLLLPIISLDADNKNSEPIKGFENGNIQKDVRVKEARINSLIRAKIDVESEAVKLDCHIFKLQSKQVKRSDVMFTIYGATRYDDESLRKEFNIFVEKLEYIFSKGEDIKPLIDSIPAHSKSTHDLYYMYVKLVVRNLYIRRMEDQYLDLVEKLRIINKELHELDPI